MGEKNLSWDGHGKWHLEALSTFHPPSLRNNAPRAVSIPTVLLAGLKLLLPLAVSWFALSETTLPRKMGRLLVLVATRWLGQEQPPACPRSAPLPRRRRLPAIRLSSLEVVHWSKTSCCWSVTGSQGLAGHCLMRCPADTCPCDLLLPPRLRLEDAPASKRGGGKKPAPKELYSLRRGSGISLRA